MTQLQSVTAEGAAASGLNSTSSVVPESDVARGSANADIRKGRKSTAAPKRAGLSGGDPSFAKAEAIRFRAAYEATVRLMRDGAKDAHELATLSLPMSEGDFLDMCEERALAHKCGNPLCQEPHQWRATEERLRVDYDLRDVVPALTSHFWCSKTCEARCRAFACCLGSRVNRLDVLRKLSGAQGEDQASATPSHNPRTGGTAPKLGDSILLDAVQERQPTQRQAPKPNLAASDGATAQATPAPAPPSPSPTQARTEAAGAHASDETPSEPAESSVSTREAAGLIEGYMPKPRAGLHLARNAPPPAASSCPQATQSLQPSEAPVHSAPASPDKEACSPSDSQVLSAPGIRDGDVRVAVSSARETDGAVCLEEAASTADDQRGDTAMQADDDAQPDFSLDESAAIMAERPRGPPRSTAQLLQRIQETSGATAAAASQPSSSSAINADMGDSDDYWSDSDTDDDTAAPAGPAGAAPSSPEANAHPTHPAGSGAGAPAIRPAKLVLPGGAAKPGTPARQRRFKPRSPAKSPVDQCHTTSELNAAPGPPPPHSGGASIAPSQPEQLQAGVENAVAAAAEHGQLPADVEGRVHDGKLAEQLQSSASESLLAARPAVPQSHAGVMAQLARQQQQEHLAGPALDPNHDAHEDVAEDDSSDDAFDPAAEDDSDSSEAERAYHDGADSSTDGDSSDDGSDDGPDVVWPADTTAGLKPPTSESPFGAAWEAADAGAVFKGDAAPAAEPCALATLPEDRCAEAGTTDDAHAAERVSAKTASGRRRVSFGTVRIQSFKKDDAPAQCVEGAELPEESHEIPSIAETPRSEPDASTYKPWWEKAVDAAAAPEQPRASSSQDGPSTSHEHDPSPAAQAAPRPVLLFNIDGRGADDDAGSSAAGLVGTLSVTDTSKLQMNELELEGLRSVLSKRVAGRSYADALAGSPRVGPEEASVEHNEAADVPERAGIEAVEIEDPADEAPAASGVDDQASRQPDEEDSAAAAGEEVRERTHASRSCDGSDEVAAGGSLEGEERAPAQGSGVRYKRPRLRGRRPMLSTPTSAPTPDLTEAANQASVLDAFRYYLSPTLGGEGVTLHSGKPPEQTPNQPPSGGADPESESESDAESDDDVWNSDEAAGDGEEDDVGGISFFGDPPKGFGLPEMSPFAILFNLLSAWVTRATVLYLKGRPVPNGLRSAPHDQRNIVRLSLLNLLRLHLPILVKTLGIRVPLSGLEGHLGELVATLDLKGPLPSFETHVIHNLLLLFLDALSRHHIQACQDAFKDANLGFQELRMRGRVEAPLYDTLMERLL